ncbi:ABC transporter substrate-binding protein [Caryophanon tenue]|uniref:ABC transporter substrate-binding protein n=1 Tax=Caryophanon tenue TaxID=33978 RepID=A0A1C0Y6T9_9BACL|nr:ABC transporter substrate-binding protein [Caryophanon tenue]OCS82897.1 ABC transporter substrate-binding protein [Caryophanon tenue]
MKSMKKFFMLPVLAAGLVLGACSADEKETSDAEAVTDTASVENLTIGLSSDVGPLNIYTGNLDWLTDMVYDKLFSPSPYVDEPTPWLAESATQIDADTWEVVVRDGITWHDGEAFTAEDVKFTYEYYRDGPANRHTHHVSEVPQIDEISIGDDGRTVTFECGYACPSLQTITFADLPILPEHIWSNVENPRKYTDLAIGTGPFKLTEYVADQHYILEANNDYFMGAPTVGKITLPIIADSTAMFNALKSGQIDASSKTVPAELVSTFKGDAQFKLAEATNLSIVQFGLNYQKAPFDNEKFRQAMSLAVDRQAIVDTILLGQGRAGDKGYPHPDSPWTNPELSTPYNTAEAIALFEELGYKDTDGDGFREDINGEALQLSIKVSSGEPIYVRAAELMVEQYKAVGINMFVEALDPTTFAAHNSEKNFDTYVSLIGPHGVADPDQFIMSHRSGYLWAKEMPYAKMDELVTKWMAASTIEERKTISFDMQTLYNEQPTAIALYYPEEVYAYNAEKFDGYVESLGYGVINKFSFLPEATQQAVSATQPVIVE